MKSTAIASQRFAVHFSQNRIEHARTSGAPREAVRLTRNIGADAQSDRREAVGAAPESVQRQRGFAGKPSTPPSRSVTKMVFLKFFIHTVQASSPAYYFGMRKKSVTQQVCERPDPIDLATWASFQVSDRFSKPNILRHGALFEVFAVGFQAQVRAA